jgi:hypothetical protein
MSDFSDWLQNNWIDLARLGVQSAILVVVVRYGHKLLATLRASQEQIGALLKLSMGGNVSAQTSIEQGEFGGEPRPEPEVQMAREPFAEPSRSRADAAAFGHEAKGTRVAITEPCFEPELAREVARQSVWEPEPLPEPAFAGPASLRHNSWRVSDTGREQSLGGRVVGSGLSASTAALDPPVAHNEPAIPHDEPFISHNQGALAEQPIPRSEVRPFTPWVSAPSTGPEVRANVAPPLAPKRGGVQSWLNAPMRRSGPGPVKKIVRWLQSPAGTVPARVVKES